MINFQGISGILVIGLASGILIGWLTSKAYYMDAEMEVFLKAYNTMPPKQKQIIKAYVMQRYQPH